MATGELLQLTPASELAFKFELKRNIPVTLSLHNPTAGRVAFKVKTTSPKKYCVRPSSGVVEPGATKEVQVRVAGKRGDRCCVWARPPCFFFRADTPRAAPSARPPGWPRQGAFWWHDARPRVETKKKKNPRAMDVWFAPSAARHPRLAAPRPTPRCKGSTV